MMLTRKHEVDRTYPLHTIGFWFANPGRVHVQGGYGGWSAFHNDSGYAKDFKSFDEAIRAAQSYAVTLYLMESPCG